MAEQRQPDMICRAGGREFRIYRAFDDFVGHDILIYPDFEERPEYTSEGRPFTTATREGCPYCAAQADREAHPGDCGACRWFRRDETPWDIIGVCLCEALRRERR